MRPTVGDAGLFVAFPAAAGALAVFRPELGAPAIALGLIVLVYGFLSLSAMPLDRVVNLLVLAYFATVTFNGFRLAGVPLADALLVLGLGTILVLALVEDRLAELADANVLLFAGLVVFSAVLTEYLESSGGVSLVETAQLLLATGGMVALIRRYAAVNNSLHPIVFWFVVGCSFSAFLASLEQAGISNIAARLVGGNNFAFTRRSQGLTTHPNQLGLASGIAFPFALYLWTVARGSRKLVAAAAAAVLVGGVVASGSRAGLLALVVVLAMAGLGALNLTYRFNLERILLVGAGGVIGVLLLFVASPSLVNVIIRTLARLTGDNSTQIANADRAERLDTAIATIVEQPLLGGGLGEAAAHSFPVQIVQALGAVGLVAFVLFLLSAAENLRSARGLSLHMTNAIQRSLAAWFAAGLFHNGFSQRYFYLPVILAFGAGAVGLRQRMASATSSPTPSPLQSAVTTAEVRLSS